MTWMSDVQRGLAWALVICFILIVVLFGVFSAIGELPDPVLDVFKQVVTALINVLMVVVGYFFGSSTGTKSKDDVIGNIATKMTNNGATNGTAPAPSNPYTTPSSNA
jgi:p-aminobenzoyl-glutamate transporter AbgT